MKYIEQETMYKNKQCLRCYTKGIVINLKKRSAPWTASQWGKEHDEYWQCPKCKANYAY